MVRLVTKERPLLTGVGASLDFIGCLLCVGL
jgi:hypothetical protein